MAIFVFKDRILVVNILEILICLVGLAMLNWRYRIQSIAGKENSVRGQGITHSGFFLDEPFI